MIYVRKLLATAAAGFCAAALSSGAAQASAAIIGPTGDFEVEYLNFILDHHYTGLRATELAAGTLVVGPTVSDPYPGDPASFPPTAAKGTNDVVLEIAVMSNMAQGMEIITGQGFLQDWYGMTALLEVPPPGEELLDTLSAAAPGDPFNIAFLTNFSMHHIMAISRSLECVDQAGHAELQDYCQMIVDAQTRGVREMRAELGSEYGIFIDDPIPGQVPEPATMGLMLVGLAGLGYIYRRRHSKMPAL